MCVYLSPFVRLRFLGKVLSVQPATKQVEKRKSQDKENRTENDSSSFTKDTIDEKSRLGSYIAREPIAERLGVDYPFPPNLEYAFKFFNFLCSYLFCPLLIYEMIFTDLELHETGQFFIFLLTTACHL